MSNLQQGAIGLMVVIVVWVFLKSFFPWFWVTVLVVSGVAVFLLYRAMQEQERVGLLRKARDEHDLFSMIEVADIAQNGDREATEVIREIAEKGHVVAQHRLAFLYDRGLGGLPVDPVEAVKWFFLAADQGDAVSMYIMGLAFERGRGVEQDFTGAYFWQALASRRGMALAEEALARLKGELDEAQIAAGEERCRNWEEARSPQVAQDPA